LLADFSGPRRGPYKQPPPVSEMNLYIVNKVLYDYTGGMAVIAAENLERMREIYLEHFGYNENFVAELDFSVANENYTVLEVAGTEEGIVSYVLGGT